MMPRGESCVELWSWTSLSPPGGNQGTKHPDFTFFLTSSITCRSCPFTQTAGSQTARVLIDPKQVEKGESGLEGEK
jgi:hypothetical protein